MSLSAYPAPTAREAGMTLVEVLISMVLLAIGLLGVAGLLVTGARMSTDAHLRTQATVAIDSLIDAVRDNRANAAAYVTSFQTAVTPLPDCSPTLHSAANDLACWERRLMQSMPPGTRAALSNPAGNEYLVSVAWTDREQSTHEVAFRFEP